MNEGVLSVIRVLIFVNQDLAKLATVRVGHIRESTEEELGRRLQTNTIKGIT